MACTQQTLKLCCSTASTFWLSDAKTSQEMHLVQYAVSLLGKSAQQLKPLNKVIEETSHLLEKTRQGGLTKRCFLTKPIITHIS